MANWRKWLPLAIGMLFVLPIIFSEQIAVFVVNAVGVEAIRAHAVLTMVLCLGACVALGVALSLVLSMSDNQYKASSLLSGIMALIFGCGWIYFVIFDIRHFSYSIHHDRYIPVSSTLSSFFSTGYLCALLLALGILQLIFWRRQRKQNEEFDRKRMDIQGDISGIIGEYRKDNPA